MDLRQGTHIRSPWLRALPTTVPLFQRQPLLGFVFIHAHTYTRPHQTSDKGPFISKETDTHLAVEPGSFSGLHWPCLLRKLVFADVHDNIGFASRLEALNAPGGSVLLYQGPSVRMARALKAEI